MENWWPKPNRIKQIILPRAATSTEWLKPRREILALTFDHCEVQWKAFHWKWAGKPQVTGVLQRNVQDKNEVM